MLKKESVGASTWRKAASQRQLLALCSRYMHDLLYDRISVCSCGIQRAGSEDWRAIGRDVHRILCYGNFERDRICCICHRGDSRTIGDAVNAYRSPTLAPRKARSTGSARLARAYFNGTLGRIDMRHGRYPSGPRWIACAMTWVMFRLGWPASPWWPEILTAIVWAGVWQFGRSSALKHNQRIRAIRRLLQGTATAVDLSALDVRPNDLDRRETYRP